MRRPSYSNVAGRTCQRWIVMPSMSRPPQSHGSHTWIAAELGTGKRINPAAVTWLANACDGRRSLAASYRVATS